MRHSAKFIHTHKYICPQANDIYHSYQNETLKTKMKNETYG